MTQFAGGIGNVIPNTGLVDMAMAYSRSRILCAAARLGIADALGDEVRSTDFLAEKCQADPNALFRLLRALASIGVTEETAPEYFRLTPLANRLRKTRPSPCGHPSSSGPICSPTSGRCSPNASEPANQPATCELRTSLPAGRKTPKPIRTFFAP